MAFLSYFNLRENPFGEAPDTHFYFPASAHEAALRKLCWAIEEDKSFLLVEGEVGNGKTLLGRMLIDSYGDEANTALVVHSHHTREELLHAICRDLGIEPGLESLNDSLLEAARDGRRTLLVMDEAQGLSFENLEFLRSLTNFETEKRKLLQIVCFAQPEFASLIAAPRFRQLRQRLQLHTQLGGLAEEETAAYIRHRIERAGGGNFVRFNQAATQWIHRQAGGSPRLVNKIAELALRFAAQASQRLVDENFLKQLPLDQVGLSPVNEAPWREWTERARVWTKGWR